MKTQIFTFAFNRPDFLKLQIKSFRKFFDGEYDINVVCDYRDEKFLKEFETICKEENVNFYKHKSTSNGNPSFYHGSVLTWAYSDIIKPKFQNDCVLIVDHDMFLIDNFNLSEYLNGYDIFGSPQSRDGIKYIWPGFVAFEVSKLKDLDFDFLPCMVNRTMLDTGGGTHKIMDKLKYRPSSLEYPDEYDGIDLTDKKVNRGFASELHCDRKFFHYRNASSWDLGYQVSDSGKTKLLFDIVKDILK